MSQKQITMRPGGTLKLFAGAGNTPALTVPTGKYWVVQSLVTDWTASATVGNRLIHAVIIAGGGAQNSWRGATSGATAAGQVCGYDIGFGCPLNTPSTTVRRNIPGTANTNVQVRENTAITHLRAGDIISVLDSAAIDAADSCAYRLVYIEYEGQ